MFEGLFDKFRNGGLQLPPAIRQNFEAFLSKMGASTRKTVAVCFSQNLGIEMLEIDNIAGVITKYATRPLAYDSANRRMESYTDFADCLVELFEEFEISSNSNVILSLPNIHLGLMQVPSILHGDAVRNVILSEVEQSYIFKSYEPLVTWYDLTKVKRDKDKQNTLIYTAIQKNVIDGIMEASQNVGCRFLTIENSYLSLIRGLSFLGYMKDQVKDNLVWQLMIVDANNFSIITLKGNIPIAYFEEPLAMKSFQDDEIYKAIAGSAMDTLKNDKLRPTHLMLISQTDFVSAEILKNELELSYEIDFLECNKYSQLALYPTTYEITPDLAEQITLSAIGTASFLFYHYPIYLNYIKETVEENQNIDDQIGNIKVNLGNIELNITKDTIRRLSLILAGILLVPLLLVYLILGKIILPKEQEKSNSLAANIEAINKQINDLTETNQQAHFDINTLAKRNVTKNKALLFNYSVIGEVVPRNLWITHTEEKDDSFLVTGIALSTKTIYGFYKNLKTIMNNNNLILTKLQFTNESLDSYVNLTGKIPSSLYKFEISSSKDLVKSDEVAQAFSLSHPDENSGDEDAANTGRITTSGGVKQKTAKSVDDYDENAKKAQELGKKAAKTLEDNSKSEEGSLPPNLKKIEDK